MDLDSMKYTELRKLAKQLGLKANMKADKLLKTIKRHHQEEKSKEAKQAEDVGGVHEDPGQDAAQENQEENSEDQLSATAAFVNTRRGKAKANKRKISESTTETESDAKPEVEDEEAAACGGVRQAKKRKVSAVKESDENEPEPPAEPEVTEQQQAVVKDEYTETKKVANGGKIPRLQQKRKQLLKPVTPNFKKLHEAHFNKMESIDCYVQRKNKQMETYRSSAKETKKLSDKTKLQPGDGKTQAKANQPSRVSLFSPVPVTKKPADDKHRHTAISAKKEDVPFRPSVLSTRRINVRFSEATRDNEHKGSLVKTPARMSPAVTTSTPVNKTTDAGKSSSVRISTFSATKTPGPFIFTGNTSTSATPGTQKKCFDLKASLARPLTYKPHKGKLKAYGETKENPATTGNKSLVSNSHQTSYKQHHVLTREDRREKQAADRKQKKQNMLGARRGLVMM